MNFLDKLVDDIAIAVEKGTFNKEFIEQKPKRKKREKLVGEEQKITYRLHEPSMKPVALLLVVHKFECQCGHCSSVPNKHVLCVKKDKYGNLHETQFFTQSDIAELPRVRRGVVSKVQACSQCFEDAKLKPVCDEDAKQRIDAMAGCDVENTKLALELWEENQDETED